MRSSNSTTKITKQRSLMRWSVDPYSSAIVSYVPSARTRAFRRITPTMNAVNADESTKPASRFRGITVTGISIPIRAGHDGGRAGHFFRRVPPRRRESGHALLGLGTPAVC